MNVKIERPERMYPFWCISKHVLSSIRNLQEWHSKTNMEIADVEDALYLCLKRLIELDGGDFGEHENVWEAIADLVEAEKHTAKQRKIFKKNKKILDELTSIKNVIRRERVKLVKTVLKGFPYDEYLKTLEPEIEVKSSEGDDNNE